MTLSGEEERNRDGKSSILILHGIYPADRRLKRRGSVLLRDIRISTVNLVTRAEDARFLPRRQRSKSLLVVSTDDDVKFYGEKGAQRRRKFKRGK
jgi:hypothetical protein